MALRAALERIMNEWPSARTRDFTGDDLAAHVRGQAMQQVTDALAGHKGLQFKGSAGAGRWAEVPWIAIYDEVVTDTATEGYYIVYLFHSSKAEVHLSLNQGATKTRSEFGSATRDVLRERAQLMRRRLSDFQTRLPVPAIDLGSESRLPGDYAAGHAMGISYTLANLPSDAKLTADLLSALEAYKALTFRGGLDATVEGDEELPPEKSETLIEQRRYKLHRRIERNPRAAKAAKKHHGAKCQACDLEFYDRYGEIGRGFIEAHHLKPIGSLSEGEEVSYDVASDFAVLCSNCHRMIHRTDAPSDLVAFRALVKT